MRGGNGKKTLRRTANSRHCVAVSVSAILSVLPDSVVHLLLVSPFTLPLSLSLSGSMCVCVCVSKCMQMPMGNKTALQAADIVALLHVCCTFCLDVLQLKWLKAN